VKTIPAWCPACGEEVTVGVRVTALIPDGLGYLTPQVTTRRTAHRCTPDPWSVPEEADQ